MDKIVYVRIAFYVLSTLIGMLPATWAGFISFDEARGLLMISVEGLVSAVLAGGLLSLGIFKAWGKR